MKCPCLNCVCIPICRNKNINYLFDDCSLIRKYIVDYDNIFLRRSDRMRKMIEIVKPIGWKYGTRELYYPDRVKHFLYLHARGH
jgi:hypothetical protein